jgi:hypothetical protein
MGKDSKDPSDERGEIIADKACACEDGCCSWHENTPAQSEGKVKTGD